MFSLQEIPEFKSPVKPKGPLKISNTQRKPDMSALKLDASEKQTYEWSFDIPPGKKLIQHLKISPASEYNFTNLQFTSGFLKNFKHEWQFNIYARNKFTIILNIYKNPDFGFALCDKSCKLQVFSQGQLKKTTKLKLVKKEFDKVVQWTCEADKYPDGSGKIRPKFYPKFWDNSGDTLKVLFEIQCESVGKCINLSSLKEGLEPLELEPTSDTDMTKGGYFLSKALSDVTLVSQGEEFPAHQIILSCSSPVFQCMFQHEMKETLEGIVSIEDIEPAVVKEMLYFIYKGGVSSSTLKDTNLCIDLFKTADKYEIKGLKMKCANSIVQTINFVNALEMYILGDMHNEPRFTQRAVKLFELDKGITKDHLKLKDLTNRCPNLAYELLTAADDNLN